MIKIVAFFYSLVMPGFFAPFYFRYLINPWVKVESISLGLPLAVSVTPTNFLSRRLQRGNTSAIEHAREWEREINRQMKLVMAAIAVLLALNLTIPAFGLSFYNSGTAIFFYGAQAFSVLQILVLKWRVLKRHPGGKYVFREKYHYLLRYFYTNLSAHVFDSSFVAESDSSLKHDFRCLAFRPGLGLVYPPFRRPVGRVIWLMLSSALLGILYFICLVAALAIFAYISQRQGFATLCVPSRMIT